MILTLVTQAELKALKVEALGHEACALGLTWLHLPIIDVSTPTPGWEAQWARDRASVHAELDGNGKVLVHCKGGLGRAGLVAARILIERGMVPAVAVAAVRKVRPGAIETHGQEAYLLHLTAVRDRAAPAGAARAG